MGRRSRQRALTPAEPRARRQPPGASAPSRPRDDAAGGTRLASAPRPRRDEAPAPWGGFPLAELCALSAIVIGVWGILRGGHGGGVMLVIAAVLGSIAGLEIAIREHLGGRRSHTLVLSGACAAAALMVAFVAQIDRATILPVAAAVFAIAFVSLRALFKRRSGGFGFRVR